MDKIEYQELLDRAKEMAMYWTGTLHERLIERAIMAEDLEALQYHVSHAEGERAVAEDFAIVDKPTMEPVLPLSKARLERLSKDIRYIETFNPKNTDVPF